MLDTLDFFLFAKLYVNTANTVNYKITSVYSLNIQIVNILREHATRYKN